MGSVQVPVYVLLLYCFLLRTAGSASPDTKGCNKSNKDKMNSLKYSNSVAGVFCSEYATCDTTQLEANDDGFYSSGQYACKHFTGEQSNIGKAVIMFFSKVQVVGELTQAYYYPQSTDKTGLFLTKHFQTKLASKGVKLEDKVEAVVPQHSPASGTPIDPTLACFNANDASIESTSILSGQTGSVYCKITAACTDLKRPGCDNLIVRTTVAEFAVDITDATDITVVNNFIFLKNEESIELDCETGAEFKWYKNGAQIPGITLQTYSYTHDQTDAIIQCLTLDVNTVWNVFTVLKYTVDSEVTETKEVAHGQSTTFTCQVLKAGIFPSPLAIWAWSSESNDEEADQLVTVANAPNLKYTKEIAYSDLGNFKCYLFNGIDDKAPAADYKTLFVVDTKIESLTPIPVNWYEYISSVPEVYYVANDPIKLSCDISKEAKYSVWWNIDATQNEYFYYIDDTLKKLETSDGNSDITAALQVVTNGWTVTETDETESLGYHTKQVLAIDSYNNGMTEETETFTAYCFLVETATVIKVTTLVAKVQTMKTSPSEQGDDFKKMYKQIPIRFFKHISKPVVKGPLNQIQSEKAAKDMILNCKTDGIPPTFIYFMAKNNKTDAKANITAELLKDDKGDLYTRYRINRASDTLTVLTIEKPTEDDEGSFTCYAINRGTGADEPEAGPTAKVYIEERCSEGAQFCFKNTAFASRKHLWTYVLTFTLFLFGLTNN